VLTDLELYYKNKLEKLVFLVGFIIRKESVICVVKKKFNCSYVELNEKGTFLAGFANGATDCVYRYCKHMHRHCALG
jgi:hypothetical protein